MRRTTFPDVRIDGVRSKGVAFQRIRYDDVAIAQSQFEDATWTDCRFSRVRFGADSRFSRCRFIRCVFEKQHTCLGAFFSECVFEACEFRNVQVWGGRFAHCVFSGHFENIVFYGPEAEESWRTVFTDVDLTAVRFEFVDFRCGIDLGTTRLPARPG